MKYKLLFMVVFVAFLGCMRMGPDFVSPTAHGKQQGDVSEVTEQDVFQTSGQWWRMFEDPEVDGLIAEVVANNPDLMAAAARIRKACAIAKQARSGAFPHLSLSVEASRMRQGFVNPITGKFVAYRSDSYNLTFPASYEIDLFGKIARGIEAAEADLLSVRANRRILVQSLVAEAVSLHFRIRSVQTALYHISKEASARNSLVSIMEKRYSAGTISLADLLSARQAASGAVALEADTLSSLEKAYHALAVLRGRRAEPLGPAGTDSTASLPSVKPVPAGLPSDLLLRRPDVQAAEAALHAACARVGVAAAARFPSITITGSFGYGSDSLSELLTRENTLWRIASGLTQPLFDAGRLAAAHAAAKAAYDEANAAYAMTVLKAFADVRDALSEEKRARKRVMAYMKNAAAAHEKYLYQKRRYVLGAGDPVWVLEAEASWHAAEAQVARAKYEQIAARIGLVKALGGDWDMALVTGGVDATR